MTNDSEVIIRLQNLTKNYGHFTAVSNVSLDLPKGEIIGFLGPNGAGKSTTLKIMAGLISPNEGEVFVRNNGELVKLTRNNRDLLLEKMGFLIETPAFYDHMTPREVLTYFAELKGYPRKQIKQRVEEVVKLVGMTKWIDKKIKTFSKGMKQKIGIVSALVHNPDILVLDEPQSGLDPQALKEIRDILLALKKSGKTIFLSSHLLYEISEVSDKVAIINQGHLIAFDTIQNLETKVKKSTLQIELLHKPENIQEKIEELSKYIGAFIGVTKNTIQYNSYLNVFEILFDGTPEMKNIILESLIAKGIKIVSFSVPRTNLVESLYLGYMNGENGN